MRHSESAQSSALTFSEFARQCFCREPDWRLQRAQYLQGRRIQRSQEDTDTLNLVAYMLHTSSEGSTASENAEFRCSRLAWRLHEETQFVTLRLELQCRVLAGQDPDAISLHTGLEKAVVQFYEAYFFDIRDRLNIEDYIYAFAIKLQPEPTIEAALKQFAYVSGVQHFELVFALWKSRFSDQSNTVQRFILQRMLHAPCLSLYHLHPEMPIAKHLRSITQLLGIDDKPA